MEERFDVIYDQLKNYYKHIFTYSSYEFPIIYIPLTRAQYYDLFEDPNMMDMEREDIICKTCIVYPENINIEKMPAGVVSDIADKILEASFMSEKGRKMLFAAAAKKMQNVDRQISCIIHEAFPEYDIEDIDNWNMLRTTDFLIRSEWILRTIQGKPPLDIEKILTQGSDITLKPEDPRFYNEEKAEFDRLRKINTPAENNKPVPKKKTTLKRPQRRRNQVSEEQLASMFPEAFENAGDEKSFKDMAMGSKNPNDMTLAELAELRNNN